MFRGKNYKASIASFDKTNSFEPEEAMKSWSIPQRQNLTKQSNFT